MENDFENFHLIMGIPPPGSLNNNLQQVTKDCQGLHHSEWFLDIGQYEKKSLEKSLVSFFFLNESFSFYLEKLISMTIYEVDL